MAEDTREGLHFADVGINLSDPIFRGIYHGKKAHEDDLADVLERAQAYGVRKFMVTGSDLKESERAVDIAREYPNICYATIGIHPCSSSIFSSTPADKILSDLRNLIEASQGHAVAFGETGLDYDRLFHCDKATQLLSFQHQLSLATSLDPPLPLFLHSRAAHEDFVSTLRPHLPKLKKPKAGLVHSFTGTVEEMRELVELGLDIGVNGCSLKTEENLEVVKEVPLERLQIETDGPWCEIRPSHASARFLGLGKENGGGGGGKKGGGDTKSNDPPANGDDGKERWEGEGRSGPPEMLKSVKREKWTKGCTVKGRNEPCSIVLVAHVVAGVKGVSVEEVARAAWKNSTEMFGLGTRQ